MLKRICSVNVLVEVMGGSRRRHRHQRRKQNTRRPRRDKQRSEKKEKGEEEYENNVRERSKKKEEKRKESRLMLGLCTHVLSYLRHGQYLIHQSHSFISFEMSLVVKTLACGSLVHRHDRNEDISYERRRSRKKKKGPEQKKKKRNIFGKY